MGIQDMLPRKEIREKMQKETDRENWCKNTVKRNREEVDGEKKSSISKAVLRIASKAEGHKENVARCVSERQPERCSRYGPILASKN